MILSDEILDLIKEEYSRHHLACNIKKSCSSQCDVCFIDDVKTRLATFEQEKRDIPSICMIRPYLTQEKAIELIEDIIKNGCGLSGYDRFDALKLSLQALRAEVARRKGQ